MKTQQKNMEKMVARHKAYGLTVAEHQPTRQNKASSPELPARRAQHSPEISYYDETTPLQWGAYDSDGKLRASFDSESEAMHYTRNRGHMDGGTYKPVRSVNNAGKLAEALETCLAHIDVNLMEVWQPARAALNDWRESQ